MGSKRPFRLFRPEERNTLRAYRADITQFVAWRDRVNATVAAHLAHSALTVSTIKRRVAARQLSFPHGRTRVQVWRWVRL